MANIKITDLTAYGNPSTTDVMPIVDVGADVTKKVSIADLLKNASAGTAAAPGIAFDGDNTGIYRPGADQVAISTGGTGRVFVDASGNVGIGTASPAVACDVVGRVRASTGILFGSDTAAANALDDYEEGIFTPAYAFDSGTATITYSALRQGRYVKVGTLVTCNIRIRTDAFAVGTASGKLRITGLPFAGDGVTFIGAFGSAVIGLSNNAAGNLVAFKPPNAQLLYLWDGPGTDDPNSATNFVQASDLITGAAIARNEVFATITYTTA